MHYQLERQASTPAVRPHQIGTRDLLAVVIRRRWLILAISLPIILMAAIGTMRSTDMVTAACRVLIEGRAPENPTFSNPIIDYNVIMSTAAQVAMSIPVAEKATASLIDSLAFYRARNPKMIEINSAEELRDAILAGVDANQVGESNILNISYRHPDPAFSLSVVGALLGAYIGYSIESQQNTRAIEYYAEQIRLTQVDIDSLMARKARIREEAGYTAFQTNAQTAANQITVMEQDYYKSRARREGLQAKLEGTLRAIETDPDFVPTGHSVENANLVGLKSELDKQTAKLAQFRIQYTEDSEWVSRQRELVESARREMRRERDGYVESLRIGLEEARQSEVVYANALAGLKASVERFPDVERQVDAIDMQINTHRELLKALQFKRGEVRLKADSDVRISNIVPLNKPAIEGSVAGSKKLLYLALASLFALSLGFLAAIFAENQDHRIYDRRRAEQMLEIPVLGAITDGSERQTGT